MITSNTRFFLNVVKHGARSFTLETVGPTSTNEEEVLFLNNVPGGIAEVREPMAGVTPQVRLRGGLSNLREDQP